jgi:hypothetical protein
MPFANHPAASTEDQGMNRRILREALPLLALGAGLAALATPAVAAQVWSGRTFAFSKAANANPTLPANQDQISPLVWITRGSTQGVYNVKSESFYSHNVSPAGTEWASGDAVNHASLTFTDWESWAGAHPPGTVGVNAVVHLIAEDIYVDIVFTSWGIGPGGAFSYRRAVHPTSPVVRATWSGLRTLYR